MNLLDVGMDESESEDSRSNRQQAEADLLSGGERVAKGRQRANEDDE